MGNGNHLGEFEVLVLLAILRLRTDAYGMAVRREIEDRAGRKTSIGALYITLDRMEAKGFITSEIGEATPERGGRAKRFFSVNPAGRQALKKSLEEVRSLADGFFPVPEAI